MKLWRALEISTPSKCQTFGQLAQEPVLEFAALHIQQAVVSTRKGLFKANSPHKDAFLDLTTLAENDIVLLKHIHNSASTPILSTRLHAGRKIVLQRDSIAHDDILGKRLRDLVSSRKRINYRITEPTLAEYTDLSPRIVTPVSSPMCF